MPYSNLLVCTQLRSYLGSPLRTGIGSRWPRSHLGSPVRQLGRRLGMYDLF